MGAGVRITSGLAGLCVAAVLAGCGGGERQDAEEPNGRFPLQVTEARFPREQRLAERTELVLTARNTGDEQIPDLAVTIYTDEPPADGSFNVRVADTRLANPNRPVWLVTEGYPKKLPDGVQISELDERGSGGTEAAQLNTFSFGALQPDGEITMVWELDPVMPGTYTVHYEMAAGLQGEARAVTPGGDPVEGEFVATISDEPTQERIDDAGNVVPANQQMPEGGGTGSGTPGSLDE